MYEFPGKSLQWKPRDAFQVKCS